MFKAKLSDFTDSWLPQLEIEMRDILGNTPNALSDHYGMMHYHMGWTNEQFQPKNQPSGKRLRPMLCLLACAEVGGNPANALPVAAAIEILHNFSLVHDDIEDGDEMRRHRPTVWKIWGVPQAVNVGDAMLVLAFAGAQRLSQQLDSSQITLSVLDLFTHTCVRLTEGQHLDMNFEQRTYVTTEEYMQMIQGKTAALIGASVEMGATIGGANDQQRRALKRFGESVGLAFQIQDDILGIWGDPSVTGKPVGNDILLRKKTLPLLHALNHNKVGHQLQKLWSDSLCPEKLPFVMDLLAQVDTRVYAEKQALAHHEAAIAALQDAFGNYAENSVLMSLTDRLLQRAH